MKISNKKSTTDSKAVKSSDQTDNAGVKKVIENKKFFYISVEEFKKKYHFYEFNRGNGTDMERVEDICYDIVNNDTDYLIFPIVINEKTGTVVDGNHTGNALIMAHDVYGVKLEIPITLINVKGLKDKDLVQELNNKRKSWILGDFIINNIKEGNINYKRLEELAEKLGSFFKEDDGKIRWRYLSSLAGKSQQQKLRDGTYILTQSDMDKQYNLGIEILNLWKASGKPKIGTWVESFIFAYINLKNILGKTFDYNILLEVLKTKKAQYEFDGSESTKVWQEKISNMLFNKDKYLKNN